MEDGETKSPSRRGIPGAGDKVFHMSGWKSFLVDVNALVVEHLLRVRRDPVNIRGGDKSVCTAVRLRQIAPRPGLIERDHIVRTVELVIIMVRQGHNRFPGGLLIGFLQKLVANDALVLLL